MKSILATKPMPRLDLWHKVERATTYTAERDFTKPTIASQMALFERHGSGENGFEKASKAASRKPRSRGRS